MIYELTNLKEVSGAMLITYNSFQDLRGEIYSTYDASLEAKLGSQFLHDKFVQNRANCLRGMHGDYKTSKIVTCLSGKITQVILDVRKGSDTYGGSYSLDITPDCLSSLLIPAGVANGFYSPLKSLYHYKLSYVGNYADADSQFSYYWQSKNIRHHWGAINPTVSSRDAAAESFKL